jgi:hypothetical protein
MEKHLMAITRFLSYTGRLVLVNSIYSSMPTFKSLCHEIAREDPEAN